MNKDKADKKWHIENCWLPAVKEVREKYEMNGILLKQQTTYDISKID